jgi:hypothetical protein
MMPARVSDWEILGSAGAVGEASELLEKRWRAPGRVDEARDLLGEAAELLTNAGAVHEWGAEAEI